jgi:hypothetical protein
MAPLLSHSPTTRKAPFNNTNENIPLSYRECDGSAGHMKREGKVKKKKGRRRERVKQGRASPHPSSCQPMLLSGRNPHICLFSQPTRSVHRAFRDLKNSYQDTDDDDDVIISDPWENVSNYSGVVSLVDRYISIYVYIYKCTHGLQWSQGITAALCVCVQMTSI